MKTHSRLKKFNGLPHELSGLDYTYDSEVEGGEVSYTPKGAQHEFIFRKDSGNIKELEKQDKLRSKREEGDRISDISFDAIAKELMLKESKQLASEGIDPFNEQNTYATGGTRLRYTPDGTLNQDTPNARRHMPKMSTGEQIGWTILDLALPLQHFTGRSPSEMWSGKTTKDPSSHGGEQTAGTQYGKFDSQYAAPMAQGVLTGMGGSGMGGGASVMGAIAGIGQASRRASQPGIDAAAADMGVRFHNADPTLKAGLESGGSAIGSTVGGFVGNNNSTTFTPTTNYAGLDSDFMYDNPQSTPTDQTDLTGDPPINIPGIVDNYSFKNGGMRKKMYSGEEGSVRKLLTNDNYGLEPIDPNLMYQNLDTRYLQNVLPEVVVTGMYDYTTVPQDQNNGPSGYQTAPMDASAVSNKKVSKMPDLNTISATIGALGQAVPALTYLGGEGKDYDKVRYPMYNPELLDATLPLRESRDTFGSSLEALRQRGQLDMGTLSELATQGAKSSSGVRQNIANVNTGIKNQAQLQNIGTLIQQFTDEAANKGNYQTQKYNAMQKLADTLAYTTRQGNMKERDKLLKSEIDNMVSAKFTELFGE